MNRKGFTLIEIIAVITIVGIIMLIAIPSVTSTISKTRRDAFVKLAHTYLNGVKMAAVSKELKCTNDFGNTWTEITDLPHDKHCYFNIQTADDSPYKEQTLNIIEKGGKSPWGGTDVVGAILFYKSTVTVNGVSETKYNLLIRLSDTGGHGTPGEDFLEESKITRENIVTRGSKADVVSGTASDPSEQPYLCYLV